MRIYPYGSWPSPVSPQAAAAGSSRFDGAAFVSGSPWWAQSVAGRTTVMNESHEMLSADVNVRSTVHMYGGGAWAVDDGGTVFFVNGDDQRIWSHDLGATSARALTPVAKGTSYAGLTMSAGVLLAVREQHLPADVSEAKPIVRDIVAIRTHGSETADVVVSLAGSTDFVAQPALSRDGRQLAWIGWNQPNMPWDNADVYVTSLESDSEPIVVSEGAGLQPQWSATGDLFFIDDRSGRWNLRAVPAGGRASLPVAPADADTGGALWGLGSSWYKILDDGRILAAQTNGADRLVVISADGVREVPTPLTGSIQVHATFGTRALVYGVGETVPAGMWLVDVDDAAIAHPVAGGASEWEEEFIPRATELTFPGKHGDVHAFYSPPTNPNAKAADDELPPVVIMIHGGPTDGTGPTLSPTTVFFTSRGIAVLDLAYGGSTGYGREYRERLRGQWGVVDVDDAISAADFLVSSGLVDPKRIAIRGGSAGGWTVLNALARTDLFAAGIARYAVTDARALASNDGEFESRYFDGLIGPVPEANDLYVARSPLTHAARITSPVLLEQGTNDPVVPQSQAEAIRDALATNGVAHAYVLFEGEGHGFRRPESIVRSYEAELGLLATVFGFDADVAPLRLS